MITKKLLTSLIMGILLAVQLQGQLFNTTWFNINPVNSNNDNSTPNGATSGRVNHVGAASDLSVIYAASEWGGLYVSTNLGVKWTKVHSFVPTAVWDVKVDPSNKSKIYVTSFFGGRTQPESGISISTDGGASWQRAPLSNLNCANASRKTEPSGWQISINPNNPDTIFVGTNCGLARSTDGGQNWQYIDPSPNNAAEQIYTVVSHGTSLVDVVGDNGHFRSVDNGTTWTSGSNESWMNPFTNSLAVSPYNSNELFRSFYTSHTQNIFVSIDGGRTWPSSLVPPADNGQGRIPFVKTAKRQTNNQFDLWYGDVSLFKATFNGTTTATGNVPVTWTNAQSGAHNDVGDILLDPRQSTDACPMLFTNDGGIYFNTKTSAPDCLNPAWEQPDTTPHATWIWGFDGQASATAGQHTLTYGLQDDGGFAATNVQEGSTSPVTPTWNNYTCCDVSNNIYGSDFILSLEGYYTSGRSFRLIRRNTNGNKIGEISTYPDGNIYGFNSSNAIARFGDKAFALLTNAGVYTTNDITADPVDWTTLPTAITSKGGIKTASVSGATNVYLFAGNGNPDGAPGDVYRHNGTAAGGSWSILPLPTNITGVSVYDVNPDDGNQLIISGINTDNEFEIWQTTDYGNTWTRRSTLESLMLGGTKYLNRSYVGINRNEAFTGYWQAFMFKYNPLNPSVMVAGAADSGIFLTQNGGEDWQLISSPDDPTAEEPHIPRPLFAYFSAERQEGDNTVFDIWIATRGSGVMKVVVETDSD